LSLQICEFSLMSVIQHNTTRHSVTTAGKNAYSLSNIHLLHRLPLLFLKT